jgi:hypothetical protein
LVPNNLHPPYETPTDDFLKVVHNYLRASHACYTSLMPNDTTADASIREQTRTTNDEDASRREHVTSTAVKVPQKPLETESVHTRTDASRRERIRKPPPENWIIIDQALLRFSAAGLPIKIRTLQKYYLKQKIRATFATTEKIPLSTLSTQSHSKNLFAKRPRKHRLKVVTSLRLSHRTYRTRLDATACATTWTSTSIHT